MKIYVYDPKSDKKIKLSIPNILLANSLTDFIIRKALENEQENQIDPASVSALTKELKNSVKIFGHYNLVEVETKDGEIVEIKM